jgi:[ribosomal protein S5]-alanine N-acetyltransferase
MPSFDNVSLRTTRLLLRPLWPSDAEALLEVHSDAAVMRYSNTPPWTSIDQARALIDQSLRGVRTGAHLCLGIVPHDAGTVVGTCTLYAIVESSRRAEIGFILGAHAWRQGYMAEALAALTKYSFLDQNLNRLEADTDPRNLRSIATLERLGFVREGFLRERWIIGEEKSDTVFYGLLRSDWENIRGPKAESGS